MINILYVDNFSEIIGGGQRSLLDLLARLDKTRFNPIFVCPSEGSLVSKLREMNIDVRIINMQSLRRLNVISFFKSTSQLIKIIRKENIGLVHANGSRAAIYAGIATKITNAPFIWHVRIADCDFPLDRFLASLSTKIVVISEAVSKRFIWIKDRQEKVKTIYNGIDLGKFNSFLSGENIRKEFKLRPDTPLIGTIGRLDWYKGYQYLLKSARKIVDIIPNCRFLIVGEGDKRKELEDLTKRLNLSENIIFTGHREDVPEILASLDLYVLSSVSEGLGRSVIEAMAMRKAVVATNVGGIPEVVQDNISGVLVQPKDSQALSGAIISLLKDKARREQMGNEGYRICQEKFSIKLMVENIEKLYSNLIE